MSDLANYVYIQCLWTSSAGATNMKDIIVYSSVCYVERVSGWGESELSPCVNGYLYVPHCVQWVPLSLGIRLCSSQG